jgi:hypothetical protein
MPPCLPRVVGRLRDPATGNRTAKQGEDPARISPKHGRGTANAGRRPAKDQQGAAELRRSG